MAQVIKPEQPKLCAPEAIAVAKADAAKIFIVSIFSHSLLTMPSLSNNLRFTVNQPEQQNMLKRLKRWLSDEHPEQVIIDMRPERPRHWHNPADPIQAARIEAAREKRERKEKKRYINAFEMFQRNEAHAPNHLCPNRLNPFHVVRS